MDFRQLNSFVYTVENKSFSAAAEKLYLSQPTISAHVHALEKELQVQLIKRTTKEFEVTSDGRRLYDYALGILRLKDKAVAEFSDLHAKILHIGVSSVPGKYILPKLLVDYHRQAPGLQFHAYHSDSMDIIQKVSDGVFDVGLVGTAPECDCTFIPFALDELVIAAPNTPHYQHLLQSGVALNVLLKEPMIMRADDSGTKREAEQFLAKFGISASQLNVVAYMNDAEALRNCIVQGLGVSIISRRMAEHPESRKDLLIFPQGKNELVRKLYIVYMHHRRMIKPVADFIRYLKKYPHKELL